MEQSALKTPTRPFKSELVLEEKISEVSLRAYHVGFEENRFRLQPLVDVICQVIPEFALGYHEGASIPATEVIDKLREAAKTVYDTDKYERRGEFGELILHLLLRDFCDTLPLVSKIYFKDSNNVTVHGFDGVHVTTGAEKKLWLGESKLYRDGYAGVRELANDLFAHIEGDYLRKEFCLISRRLPESTPDIEHWRNLMHKHQTLENIYKGICIPMVCTYSSGIFTTHKAATTEYVMDFTKECYELKKRFESHRKKPTTSVEAILMLLPVSCKDELVGELDKRLDKMRGI